MTENNHDKGLRKRAELSGERDSLERLEQLRQFDEGFTRLLTDVCSGEVWPRTKLPAKIRSMVTVAADPARGSALSPAATNPMICARAALLAAMPASLAYAGLRRQPTGANASD